VFDFHNVFLVSLARETWVFPLRWAFGPNTCWWCTGGHKLIGSVKYTNKKNV
jgi:hypothetical protein